jgi:pimeloyl-ACP methyl ester carboxylesterase
MAGFMGEDYQWRVGPVKHRSLHLGDVQLFYREAGSPQAPPVVLLHGFPSSSYQFRHLLPALAADYHAIAPDFPGFGFSSCPSRDRYSYTFHQYADTIEAFLQAKHVERCALYVHDYGAQVAFRLALRNPRRIAALIIQNSEIHYEDGRSLVSWLAMEDYWGDPSPAKRAALRDRLFTEDGIRSEFLEHLPREISELIDPAVPRLAWAQISRPGVIEALLDLHLDYRTNVELYPMFQECLRECQPATLIIWGREDQYYSETAALAYKRELPGAEVRIVDGGHWSLESHGPQVIALTGEFLARAWPPNPS